MLTIILSMILFGFGGWVVEHTGYFVYSGNGSRGIDYATAIFTGLFAGCLIGLGLSALVFNFVARKYPVPVDKKIPLLPFSDRETYLLKHDGDISYCRDKGVVQTTSEHEIAYIKVDNEEKFPYVAHCFPERASFWGLFAVFIFGNFTILVVPQEKMIKRGRVDITITTNYRLVLE